ncbi:MAG: esterase-like activity of phytase family protein, partial [Rubricella sp.]
MIRAAVLFAILALPVLAQGLPPPVSLLSQTVWREDLPGFGGFSGLMVAPGGESFLAVTDRGVLARARLERNGSGLVTGIALERFEPLVTPLGRPLGRYATDAEDLAPGEDGGLYISFEGEHRLRWYPAPHARPRPRPGHPDFAGLQTNSG